MSDSAQGPGWWQASDGRWYPPHQEEPPTVHDLTPVHGGHHKPAARWLVIAAAGILVAGSAVVALTGGSHPAAQSSSHGSAPSTTAPQRATSDSTSEDDSVSTDSSDTNGSDWETDTDDSDTSWSDDVIPSTTSEPPTNDFAVTSLIGQHADDPSIDSLIHDHYVCHQKNNAAGTFLCPASGLIVEESITSDLIMGTTMVVSATSDEGSSFQTFTGTLPFGMTWNSSRAEIESMLTSRYGQPINVFDGGPDSYVSEDYTITDMNYAGLTVQFGNNTGTLIRLAATLDPPIGD